MEDKGGFPGAPALIMGLLALWPGAACLAAPALIIGLLVWKVRKAAPTDRASFMAFMGAAALIIGLLIFLKGWDQTRVDELFELSLPFNTIATLYPYEQQARSEAMTIGAIFALTGIVLLLLSRRFLPSSVLVALSLVFGCVTVLHYWNLKTAFWTGIGGSLYHDHAREHEQVVGLIAGVGWIIASLLFLLWVRLSQALIKSSQVRNSAPKSVRRTEGREA